MEKGKLIDTNILLDKPQILEKDSFIISVKVLKELDGLKKSLNKEVAEKARRAAVYISRHLPDLKFNIEEESMPTDDWLLNLAKRHQYSIVTNDVYLKVRAAALGIETHGSGQEEKYTGISYLQMEGNEEIVDECYIGNDITIPSIGRKLKENEYLVIKGNEKDLIFKKKDNITIPVKFTTIKNQWINEIKPKNSEQICFFDALVCQNNSIIYAGGKYGTGY